MLQRAFSRKTSTSSMTSTKVTGRGDSATSEKRGLAGSVMSKRKQIAALASKQS
jgi:hypothetical protein